MAPLCRTSSGCLHWFCWLDLVYYLASLFSSVSYWEPMWGTYNSWVHSSGVVLLSATVVGWSKWFVLCVAVFQSCCILMLKCGDCPTAGRDMCEWVFYTQMCWDFHPFLVWPIYLRRAWTITSLVFCCELYVLVNGIKVFQESIFCDDWRMVKVSSTNLFQR